ncbi:multicopper oxidase family protein, partial [Methylobacterium sp. WL2]
MTSSRPVPPTDPRTGQPSRRTLLATAAAFGLMPETGRAQAPGTGSATPVPPPADAAAQPPA